MAASSPPYYTFLRARRDDNDAFLKLYRVEATSDPCTGCGEPIQPGQLYIKQQGPRHLGCGEPRKPRRAW